MAPMADDALIDALLRRYARPEPQSDSSSSLAELLGGSYGTEHVNDALLHGYRPGPPPDWMRYSDRQFAPDARQHGEVRNREARPTPELQERVAEGISPVGNLYTPLREGYEAVRGGDPSAIAEAAVPLAAMALPIPGAKRASPRMENPIQVYHGTPYSPEAFGAFDLAKTAPHARISKDGEIYFSGDRSFAETYVDRSSSGRQLPKDQRGQGHVIEAKLHAEPTHFLDYNAGLDQQGQRVRDAAESILTRYADPISPDYRSLPDVEGNTFMHWLRQHFKADPAVEFGQFGVPGIRWVNDYGNPNYGVWDTRIIVPDRRGAEGPTLPRHILDKLAPTKPTSLADILSQPSPTSQ